MSEEPTGGLFKGTAGCSHNYNYMDQIKSGKQIQDSTVVMDLLTRWVSEQSSITGPDRGSHVTI